MRLPPKGFVASLPAEDFTGTHPVAVKVGSSRTRINAIAALALAGSVARGGIEHGGRAVREPPLITTTIYSVERGSASHNLLRQGLSYFGAPPLSGGVDFLMQSMSWPGRKKRARHGRRARPDDNASAQEAPRQDNYAAASVSKGASAFASRAGTLNIAGSQPVPMTSCSAALAMSFFLSLESRAA